MRSQRPGRSPASPVVSGAVLLLLGPAVAAAQPAGPTVAGLRGPPDPPLDTTSLADGPYASMSTRFEKTFLGFDVADVRVRFGPATAGRIRRLASGAERTDALSDSVAAAAIRTDDAFAEIRFLRSIGLERYVEATLDNMRRAMDAGILGGADFFRISRGLPRWYSFLEERGLREGDRLLYRIRGDSLRTVYLSPDGETLLDLTHVGPERPRAVLGGFLAPGADFRGGLLDSVFRGRRAGAEEASTVAAGGGGGPSPARASGTAPLPAAQGSGPATAGTSWRRSSAASWTRARE